MTILQWSDNQILVSVAAGASSGPVLVMVNNAPSNGIDFSVSPQPAPVKSEWTAIALLSLAAGAHQGWSANLFTTSSDMFARSAVGAVVGAFFAGHILQLTHSYAILFAIAASAYLLALLILHLLAPGLKKVEFTA